MEEGDEVGLVCEGGCGVLDLSAVGRGGRPGSEAQKPLLLSVRTRGDGRWRTHDP